ncbi:Subtilase family protein [Chitinophaga sp. YR627]|uniref:S8 family peptidase n=1 Tax=Chitinophaga sp. YR627 TaxID=1881041 RepID=UPI0008E0B19F|nr:S8 family serine peptidase [Chitinophaga sp. YR627]SFN19616.1 Subtilase family protein [Chitinophaga sp. YR627]
MKLTVNKFLNVRAGEASLNAPCYQFLAPGSELEVDGLIYKGDSFDGIDTWYKDLAGNYYWSGGLHTSTTTQHVAGVTAADIEIFRKNAVFPPMLIDWSQRLTRIPAAIRQTAGAGIRVAVLDSGMEMGHLDMINSVSDSTDFTNSANADRDVQGHGTAMASLIAAKSFSGDQGITGVAPSASIYAAKVMFDRNDPGNFLSVGKGLDYALQQKADVINMSIGRADAVAAVAEKIAQITSAVMFAAAGDWTTSPQLVFPASAREVIPVCAISKAFFDQHQHELPTPLIIIPDRQAWCCSIIFRHYYREENGSSFATAIMSGIAALLLSARKNMPRDKNAMLAALSEFGSTVEQAFNAPETELHFIVKS